MRSQAGPRPPRARATRAWLLALLAVVASPGCNETNKYVEPPPPEVTVATPVTQDVTNYIDVTGTTQPILSVDIRARVRGFLKERHFKEGSIVKKDQLLLVIDDVPFQVRLEQAKSRLAESEAMLKKAKQSRLREVARAQVALDQSQLKLAQLDETRQRNLFTKNAGTREEMDRTEANRKKNEAQVDAASANLDQAEADYETTILAAEANAATARTAVKDAEIELGYCRMYSPIDGRISRINFHEGNLVGDGMSSLLATVIKIDPIYAYVNMSEADLLRYRAANTSPGQSGSGAETAPMTMELGLSNEADRYPHLGVADYQDPGVDAGTGTIRVRGVFPNPNGRILPGFFVRVRVPLDRRKDALLVPDRALGIDQSGSYLLVVNKENVVEYRPVKTGASRDGLRVVEGAIGPKDLVVIDGLLRARPKLKVTPKPEAPEAKSIASNASSPRP
ncbi:efflux RND transporter periplasmic adaptor subunit [Singulisphaera rosea]